MNDMKSAKWAIVPVIAYFVLFGAVFHRICPMALITGLPCPGCGLTRAGLALLRFHFAEAWQMHPFIYPLVISGVLYLADRYVFRGKYTKVLNGCLICVLVGMILFYLWRMWRYFPGKEPMVWYEGSLLQRFLQNI